ncbi:Activity-regulated cytoskeleton associated protein 1 [Anthophora retusa]
MWKKPTMVYGLLRLPLRAKIARESISSFSDLIRRTREVERLEREEQLAKHSRPSGHKFAVPYSKERNRCNFCQRNGHTAIKCRYRRYRAAPPAKTETYRPPVEASKPMQPPQGQTFLRCYGCGKPGFVRSKCPDCSKTLNAPTAGAAFCSVSTTSIIKPRPTVNLTIAGEGHAFLDTGARCSIASQNLHALLEKKGVKFEETRMQIALADGHPRIQKVQVTELETALQDRTIKTKFIVLPGSKNNRTLLGVDFIDDAGIILNIPQ